ncbi:hypothetical protein [Holospora curviuscula]|uniref:Uncharacterized protein n=1 Tax=Holospora curviuscula TaxID=1082868 RepID=A0A2S5R9T7_9PROT|nr:hypothetical protein [Holospora curviuscula]PPE04060.1 hypothetical protein HCUR_00595 [Holospora curviuscula]
MGFTLGLIELLTGSLEVLTFWVKKIFLTNISAYVLILLTLIPLRNNGLTLHR